jgi:hypothetical protein
MSVTGHTQCRTAVWSPSPAIVAGNGNWTEWYSCC